MTTKDVKAVANVWQTSDYNKFRKMECNRELMQNRFDKIKASLQEKEILNPIVVNERMEIVDGQGRYEALKSLGRPIRFVVAKGANIDDCRRMNHFNKSWSLGDFVYSYAAGGNSAYKRIMALQKETGAPYVRLLAITGHGTNGEDSGITNGKLVFTEEDAAEGRKVLRMASEIIDALQYTSRVNDTFYRAVAVMFKTKGYEHSRMLRNCRANRASYSQMSNMVEMLTEFSRIYNFRTRSEKLYFEDYMRNKGKAVREYAKASWLPNSYGPDVSTLK